MNEFTPFPTVEDALQDLHEFFPVVWEAMDSAVAGAASFFADAVIDACLFPNLVRYHAKQFFAYRQLVAVDEEDAPAEFDSIGLANNGLCVVCSRYAVRIRKSDNGLIPIPGPSYTLQQFYRQQPLPFNLANRPAQIVDTSLLILWHVDAGYRLSGLDLCCPQEGGTTRSSVKHYWSVRLDNPMTMDSEVALAAVGDLEGIEAISESDAPRQHG